MSIEMRTVEVMIGMYCRAFHDKGRLCPDCSALLDYARERIAKCPFGIDKPVCSRCTVHCYRPEMRARIQTVMRYAGPRMMWRHPVLAVRHFIRSGKR
jgi:predicted amidophosphoribosyltransferase